jgi:transposase InsO family protein
VPLIEHLRDPDTGQVVPITLVTDNGGPFRSFRFAALIAARPELRHVRTRVKSPGQNGVRERAFQPLKYERLYPEPIGDPTDLVREADAYRAEFNTVPSRGPGLEPALGRPHRRRQPEHTHLSPSPRSCQLLDAGH